MTRITVYLSESELKALQQQAERDLRGPREQARYLIIRGLAAETAMQAGHNSAEAAARPGVEGVAHDDAA